MIYFTCRRERFGWIHDMSLEILSGVLDGDGDELLTAYADGDAMHATGEAECHVDPHHRYAGEAAGRAPAHQSRYDEQPPPNATLGYTYAADHRGQTRLCVTGRGGTPHASSANTAAPIQTETLRPNEPRNRAQHAQQRARPRQQGGGKRRRLGPAI